ncbi:YveK family protein [Anaerosporobacter sp.]
MGDEIQLEDIKLSIFALWEKKLLIIAMTILTFLVGLFLTYDTQPINTYQASTTVYSVAYGKTKESLNSSIALISYADIVTSTRVCERAALLISETVDVDASSIQSMIGVRAVSDSVIEIGAVSTNPQLSILVTNAVAEAFVREITSITSNDTIQILDSAEYGILSGDGHKDLLKKRILFGMIGFVLSCGWIIISELTSNRVKSIVQCIDQDENEILGIIPYTEFEK